MNVTEPKTGGKMKVEKKAILPFGSDNTSDFNAADAVQSKS